MNRITNKHKRHSTGEWGKHPRPSLKKLGNKRLRADAFQLKSAYPKYKKKKIHKRFTLANRCPFCLAHIAKQWQSSEYKHLGSCKPCGATKQGHENCSKCHSTNVWKKNHTLMCKRCGKTELDSNS